jgi:tartrate dehydratase beta subunit/fumarate hydratase class I family protein
MKSPLLDCRSLRAAVRCQTQAICRIEVVDFPAFIVILDENGNDFFQGTESGVR